MASQTHLSLSFFLLFSLFSSLHVHGRDSKFFSKLTHVTKPAASPAPAPAEADADGQTGYGLFGHDTETPSEGLAGERQGMSDTRFMENGKYYYDPSGENTNSGGGAGASFMSTNNNGGGAGESNNEEMYQGHAATYNTERQGMSDTRFLDNGKYYHDLSNDNTNYDTNQQGVTGETLMSTNNNQYNTNNNEYNTNNNGYANTERQGMSDTRFMDNGKYYYNPTDGNNSEGLAGESLMSNNNGYENTDNYVGGFDTEQEDNSSSNNNNNERYEFDSMEEYEKYQESKQQGYSP